MRILARVLLGLGAFLVIAGVLAVAWAPGVVKKTPLDVDSHTVYEGEAAKIDAATGDFDKKPVYAIQDTKADADKSSDDHVLFVETSCLVVDTGGARECVNGNDPDLITADIDIFATDRVTAMAVDDENLPADSGPHEGLINKWPFDVEQKTYPYWDGTIGRTVDMKYDGTEEIEGLETYRFTSSVSDEEIEVAEGVPGTYSNAVTVNVDPKTGAIVKGAQDQQRFLEDGTPALDVQIVWTEDTINDAVDDIKSQGMLLTLLLTVLPIVGFVGGALCLIGGFLLLRRQPNAQPAEATAGE
jgi:hypothetical protein